MSRTQVSTPPRSPLDSPKQPTSRPPAAQRGRLLAWALVLAALVAFGGAFSRAWQQTRLREAYLPDLEVQARRTPDDARLLGLLGARLMEASEWGGAADALGRAVSSGDEGDEVWLSLAAANAARGRRGAALGDLALARQKRGDTPALQDAQARVDALPPLPPGPAGDAALTQALSPTGPGALLRTHAAGSALNGVSEWWGRRHSESSGFATRQDWARQAPDDAQALRLWGLALMQNRRLPEAGAALTKAAALAPGSPAVHLALGDFYGQAGLPAKAGLEYIAALQRRPDWMPALLGLGRIGVAESTRYGVAAYRRATQVAPRSAEAWIGLGRAYSQSQDDYSRALTAFAAAARLAPGRTDFLPAQADVLRQMGRWDEAEPLLRRRLAAAPDDAFSHYLLGRVLLDSHPSPARQAEAEAQTREALRLSPESPVAQAQLGGMLLARGDAAGAVKLLEGSLSGDPYNVNTLHTLARAYVGSGQPARAQAVSARAQSLFSDQQRVNTLRDKEHERFTDISLHQQLADLYVRVGRPDRVAQEREIAQMLRKDPAKVDAQEKALDADLTKLLPQDTPAGH